MASEDWLPTFNEALDAWDKRFIITSPDVDGLLCAALLSDVFGARLIGIYTTRHLVIFDGHTNENARGRGKYEIDQPSR